MKEDYFVNIAIEQAIKLYLSCKNDKKSITYNCFLVVIIRALALIYGETDILNPYYLNNKVIKTLGKGNKERLVYFGDYAKDLLSKYLHNERKELVI